MQKLTKSEWLLYKQNLAFRKRFACFAATTGNLQLFMITLTVPDSTHPDFFVKGNLLHNFQINLVKSHGVTSFIWTASKVNGIAKFRMLVVGSEEPNTRWKQLWEKKLRAAYGYEWQNQSEVFDVTPLTEAPRVTDYLITENRLEGKNWGSSRNLVNAYQHISTSPNQQISTLFPA